MSNINNLSPGHIARITGTLFQGEPILERFSAVARDIEAINQDEALAQAQEAYADMWEVSVRLAARVSELRALGHRNSRESRVLEILDCAIKALESEGLGI
jgi:hypothetical protein